MFVAAVVVNDNSGGGGGRGVTCASNRLFARFVCKIYNVTEKNVEFDLLIFKLFYPVLKGQKNVERQKKFEGYERLKDKTLRFSVSFRLFSFNAQALALSGCSVSVKTAILWLGPLKDF